MAMTHEELREALAKGATEEMIEAGRLVLEEEIGSGQGGFQTLTHAELAARVWDAMWRVSPVPRAIEEEKATDARE